MSQKQHALVYGRPPCIFKNRNITTGGAHTEVLECFGERQVCIIIPLVVVHSFSQNFRVLAIVKP